MGLSTCEACGAPRSFASPNVAVCAACVARALDVVRKALPAGSTEYVTAFAAPLPPPAAPPTLLGARDRRWLRVATAAFVALSLAITGALAAEFIQSLGHPHVRLGPRAYRTAGARTYAVPPRPAPAFTVPRFNQRVPLGSGPVPAYAAAPGPAHPPAPESFVPASATPAPYFALSGPEAHNPWSVFVSATAAARRGVDLTIQRTTLPRSAIDRLTASILGSAPSAHVTPCTRGGQALGLAIDHIVPGSPLQLAGLQDHDVIAAINGYPTLASYGPSDASLMPVGGPTMVVAEVLRGGHWVVLAVDWSASSAGR